MALPAYLAATAMARPKIQELAAAAEKAGLATADQIMKHFAGTVERARTTLEGRLHPDERNQVRTVLERTKQQAERQWAAMKEGMAQPVEKMTWRLE